LEPCDVDRFSIAAQERERSFSGRMEALDLRFRHAQFIESFWGCAGLRLDVLAYLAGLFGQRQPRLDHRTGEADKPFRFLPADAVVQDLQRQLPALSGVRGAVHGESGQLTGSPSGAAAIGRSASIPVSGQGRLGRESVEDSLVRVDDLSC